MKTIAVLCGLLGLSIAMPAELGLLSDRQVPDAECSDELISVRENSPPQLSHNVKARLTSVLV